MAQILNRSRTRHYFVKSTDSGWPVGISYIRTILCTGLISGIRDFPNLLERVVNSGWSANVHCQCALDTRVTLYIFFCIMQFVRLVNHTKPARQAKMLMVGKKHSGQVQRWLYHRIRKARLSSTMNVTQ